MADDDKPMLMKQAMAMIDSETTVVCLHIAGVVVPVEEPFDTLAGQFDEPPFHIHCRTLVAPWIPGMAQTMHDAAMAELQHRPLKQRRLGPDGEVGGRIPPPSNTNFPTGPKLDLSDHESDFRPMGLQKPPQEIYIPDEDEYEDVMELLRSGNLTKENAHEHGQFAEEIVSGLGTWTQGLEGMNKLRNGELDSQLAAMQAALAEAPPAPTLYRGMFWMDDDERDALINVSPGDSIQPRTAFSFTSSRGVAEDYMAWIEDEDTGDEMLMGVIYKLEGGRGIDMQKFTRDTKTDAEWLVGHDLVVKSKKQIGDQVWEITVGR